MSRHTPDDGARIRRTVDHEYVLHHEHAEPGLLVVRGVPAEACATCDEYWFDEDTGFALSRVLEERAMASAAGRLAARHVAAAQLVTIRARPRHAERRPPVGNRL